MHLTMSGLDYSAAPIALREQLSFTRNGVVDMDRLIAADISSADADGFVHGITAYPENSTAGQADPVQPAEPEPQSAP